MQCPKCSNEMAKVQFEGIEVDRCTNCQGLWFDALEQETLVEMQGSESIDVGDTTTGIAMNSVAPVICPACRVAMGVMFDPQQPHIEFESCPKCFGTFFDAGEFRGFREGTLMDAARRAITKKTSS